MLEANTNGGIARMPEDRCVSYLNRFCARGAATWPAGMQTVMRCRDRMPFAQAICVIVSSITLGLLATDRKCIVPENHRHTRTPNTIAQTGQRPTRLSYRAGKVASKVTAEVWSPASSIRRKSGAKPSGVNRSFK